MLGFLPLEEHAVALQDAVLGVADHRHGAQSLAFHHPVPGNGGFQQPSAGQLDPLDDLALGSHGYAGRYLGHVRSHHVHAEGGHQRPLQSHGHLQVLLSLDDQHVRRRAARDRIAVEKRQEVDVVRPGDAQRGRLDDGVPPVQSLAPGLHAEHRLQERGQRRVLRTQGKLGPGTAGAGEDRALPSPGVGGGRQAAQVPPEGVPHHHLHLLVEPGQTARPDRGVGAGTVRHVEGQLGQQPPEQDLLGRHLDEAVPHGLQVEEVVRDVPPEREQRAQVFVAHVAAHAGRTPPPLGSDLRGAAARLAPALCVHAASVVDLGAQPAGTVDVKEQGIPAGGHRGPRYGHDEGCVTGVL